MIDYKEFKKALAQKLADEGTYFTSKDIKKTKTTKNGFCFTVGDYTHLTFWVEAIPETDLFMAQRFGRFFVSGSEYYTDYPEEIEKTFGDWANNIESETERIALEIGYHIANTF